MESADQDPFIEFGPFRLHGARRKLLCGNDEVRIGGRAMDILIALATRMGELVRKQELFQAAWPDVHVQEANLKVTVASLRRELRRRAPSDNFIHTVVGRGYWLGFPSPVGAETPTIDDLKTSLPEVPKIVGRDPDIVRLQDMLAANRLVTVVGAGGMGKTTLATAAAHRIVAESGRSAAFVDFSRVPSEEFVAASLAAALGVNSGSDSLQAVSAILARQEILLVLDTCEHLINTVAQLCDVLLTRTRQVRIVATSRQPLRIQKEQLLWLAPLDVPPEGSLDNIDAVLRYSAPQLLVSRAFKNGRFAPSNVDAQPLAQICRRLDGSPLAIELVASRVAARGARTVSDELEDRFLLLRRDRRHGPSRQRTLLVTLKWSYALLTEQEAAVLRALSIFAGSFSSEAGIRVATNAGLSPIEALDAIAGLRAKSMLTVGYLEDDLRFRLLESTKAFARELRDALSETPAVALAHARLVLDTLGRAATDQPTMSPGQWRARYLSLIDELRQAVDWAISRSSLRADDPLLGIELVAAGLPLWHELSLGEEIRSNCKRALADLRRMRCSNTALELKLVVGLAAVSTYLATDPDEVSALFQTAVELARSTGDPQSECRALGAFATYELMRCRVDTVLEALTAMRAAAIRTKHPAALWEEGQLRAQYEIRMGNFDAALVRVQQLYDEIRGEAERAVPRFQIHQKINVEIQMAALNWLSGRPSEALRVAAMAAADARQVGHGLTLIHSLAQGVVWTLVQCGEYEAVLPHIDALRDAIYRHGLAGWIPVADTYTAAIAAFLGRKPDPARLRSAFYGVRAGMPQLRHDARYALLAEAMLANNQPDDAAEIVRHVFGTSPNLWGRSEFLRILAATQRAAGREGDAELTLTDALRHAKSSGSIAWTLRSALDFAVFLAERGRELEAGNILAPVCQQFSDEYETRDLRNARNLLAQISRSPVSLNQASQ